MEADGPDGYTAYLVPQNCAFENDKNDKFSVSFILHIKRKKEKIT